MTEVLVPTRRMPRWIENFTTRHGVPSARHDGGGRVVLTAPDGCVAVLEVPLLSGVGVNDVVPDVLAHLSAPRRLAVVLIRRGGYAVGLAEGTRLVASKVGTRYVQGRTAAGGWSQHRFARRRENQADALVGSTVEVALRVLGSEVGAVAAVLPGGDRSLIEDVLADRRLATLAALPRLPAVAVADPRLRILQQVVADGLTVAIRITDPEAAPRNR